MSGMLRAESEKLLSGAFFLQSFFDAKQVDISHKTF